LLPRKVLNASGSTIWRNLDYSFWPLGVESSPLDKYKIKGVRAFFLLFLAMVLGLEKRVVEYLKETF
jgi:hypothetical protein